MNHDQIITHYNAILTVIIQYHRIVFTQQLGATFVVQPRNFNVYFEY
jgi:hypothetical protein